MLRRASTAFSVTDGPTLSTMACLIWDSDWASASFAWASITSGSACIWTICSRTSGSSTCSTTWAIWRSSEAPSPTCGFGDGSGSESFTSRSSDRTCWICWVSWPTTSSTSSADPSSPSSKVSTSCFASSICLVSSVTPDASSCWGRWGCSVVSLPFISSSIMLRASSSSGERSSSAPLPPPLSFWGCSRGCRGGRAVVFGCRACLWCGSPGLWGLPRPCCGSAGGVTPACPPLRGAP